jgi:hypothetical protein
MKMRENSSTIPVNNITPSARFLIRQHKSTNQQAGKNIPDVFYILERIIAG